ERTVEETLRICSPVHIFQRWALEPAEIDGVSFKLGDKVSLILAAANLDPAKFTDPLIEYGPTAEIFKSPKVKRTEDYITGRYG
ncbi:cytochrome P450, partial [Rhizobium ruizarguesonis]